MPTFYPFPASNMRLATSASLGTLLSASVYVINANPTRLATSTPTAKLCPGNPKPRFAMKLAPGFEGTAVVGGMSNPRAITLDRGGNILAVERGKGITGHFVDADGCVTGSKVIVEDIYLNHGVAISKTGKTLFATSREFAWSWDYDPITMTARNRRTLVTGMATEKQLTRTILASKVNPNFIMISMSAGEGPDFESFDPAVGRAQIRAFDITKLPPGGAAYNSSYGEVLGYGLSNAVGITEDNRGLVYAGDNGAAVYRLINGTRITLGNDNPAEGIYKLSSPMEPQNIFAGYPYCFAVWDAEAINDKKFEIGQLLSVEPETLKSDDWCKRTTAYPSLILPAHSAPLDIKFGVGDDTKLYVAMHGNGFLDPTQGFKVISIEGRDTGDGWAPTDSKINATYTEILSNDISYAEQCLDAKCFRPLGLAWSENGQNLYVSSDNTGEVFIVKKKLTQQLWDQCGGLIYRSIKACADGLVCKYRNILFSQCIPQ